jgi:hypothetical protein
MPRNIPRQPLEEFGNSYVEAISVGLWFAIVHGIPLSQQHPGLLVLLPDRVDDVAKLADTVMRRRLASVAAKRHPIGPRAYMHEWIAGVIATLARTGTITPYTRWHNDMQFREPRQLPRHDPGQREADRAMRGAVAAGEASVEELLHMPPGKGA